MCWYHSALNLKVKTDELFPNVTAISRIRETKPIIMALSWIWFPSPLTLLLVQYSCTALTRPSMDRMVVSLMSSSSWSPVRRSKTPTSRSVAARMQSVLKLIIGGARESKNYDNTNSACVVFFRCPIYISPCCSLTGTIQDKFITSRAIQSPFMTGRLVKRFSQIIKASMMGS